MSKAPQLSNLDNFSMSYEHLKVVDIFRALPKQQTEFLLEVDALSKFLVAQFIKVASYTSCQLLHN